MKTIARVLAYGFIFWSGLILIFNRHDPLFYIISFVFAFGTMFALIKYLETRKMATQNDARDTEKLP